MSEPQKSTEGAPSFVARPSESQSSGARAALYVRVSTREQTTETQEAELRRWAERLGLEVVRRYADTASGARSDQAALAAVLTAAHRREFKVLLIWSLDRLSREGIGAMARYVEQFRTAGIRKELRRRRAAGQGWKKIARAMKAPTSTLRRKFQGCQKSASALRHGVPCLAGDFEGPEGVART